MSRAATLERSATVLAVTGGIALVLLGVRSDMGASDAASLAALGAGTTLLGGGLAVAWLARARRATLAVQIAVLAVVPLVTALAATFLGSRTMFFSSHDQVALAILLLGAGTVSLATALALGGRVARSGEALVSAARSLGDGERLAVGEGYGSAEFDALARQLDESARRLEEARRAAEALEASRRELIAWVSHDLRTPLAGIRAITEALEDRIVDDPDTVARYHATLGQEVTRLGVLVDDLFELSRAQHGLLDLDYQQVTLDDLLADAVAGIQPVADAKGVRVRARGPGDGLTVRGAPVELQRALRNILVNALRHTPADGSITVEATVEGDDALVSVVDTGGGIDDQDLPRVFEAGFRGDPARTPGQGGAGLGLAIAQALVAAHHGDITVANDDGGARFVVRLPVDLEGGIGATP